MADLTKFVNPALKSGQGFDVYFNSFPKIGTGDAKILETLHANLTVKVSVLGNSFDGEVDILMPDLAPSGTCTITVLGTTSEAPYTTSGDKLSIEAAGRTLTLYRGSKSWSWIAVSGIPGSIGVWPAGTALDDDAESDLSGVEC